MPKQAFRLKQYGCSWSPVSKICDNEDTLAPLGQSEELSVQNPVSEPIPEESQHPEEGSKRPSAVNAQDVRDVFPNQPSGTVAASNCSKREHESAARIVETTL